MPYSLSVILPIYLPYRIYQNNILDIKKVGITQNNNWNEPRQPTQAGEGVTGEPGANERERSEREGAGGSPVRKRR